MWRRAVLALALVALAGCGGLGPGADDGDWRVRLVVQNAGPQPTTVTATVDATPGGRVVEETRRLAPGETWVVTTLPTGSAPADTYSVALAADGEVSIEHAFDTRRASGSGATLYLVGGGTVVSCGGSVDCWQNHTAARLAS
jgi:hypothetical protein